ncbi:AP2 domain protein [Theileria parva strain Muguga]|uniref:AP2/ERF domain-containing protein n=1 Tax=Theileria parva TaxID=5875 RepID=Q4N5R4_THEPA|nr:AP2 domain protein [Theileria parva strain Muguga]EAN32509.1 AP2 domain protein [Theileria parva strain Muguga]|eukprot:XP_764792.1 hypothetical protein [Theileria parva strain Muguga]
MCIFFPYKMALKSTDTQDSTPDSSEKSELNSESESPDVKVKKDTLTSKKDRRKGKKIIPKDANLLKNIPEEHYFSDVSGVYYHFKKMEWRTICKDPFNNSKRSQKTFGINKYGFYEAKRRAENKAFEITERNHISKVLSACNQNLFSENHLCQIPSYPSTSYTNSQLDNANNISLKNVFDNSPYSGKMPPNYNNYSCHNGNFMVYHLNDTTALNNLPQPVPYGPIPAVNNRFYHSVPHSMPCPLLSMDNTKTCLANNTHT